VLSPLDPCLKSVRGTVAVTVTLCNSRYSAAIWPTDHVQNRSSVKTPPVCGMSCAASLVPLLFLIASLVCPYCVHEFRDRCGAFPEGCVRLYCAICNKQSVPVQSNCGAVVSTSRSCDGEIVGVLQVLSGVRVVSVVSLNVELRQQYSSTAVQHYSSTAVHGAYVLLVRQHFALADRIRQAAWLGRCFLLCETEHQLLALHFYLLVAATCGGHNCWSVLKGSAFVPSCW
jgi:hypothetical protein